jgi:hypothetical protein
MPRSVNAPDVNGPAAQFHAPDLSFTPVVEDHARFMGSIILGAAVIKLSRESLSSGLHLHIFGGRRVGEFLKLGREGI